MLKMDYKYGATHADNRGTYQADGQPEPLSFFNEAFFHF